MSPYFTPDRIPALLASASSWAGTPFAPEAGIKGVGACCHRLCVGVLADAGFPISQSEIPKFVLPLNRATHHPGSLMADWLDAHPERFGRTEIAAPGDVLLIRLGVGAHHAGVCLPNGWLVHTWQHTGAVIVVLTPKIADRIMHIYRPHVRAN